MFRPTSTSGQFQTLGILDSGHSPHLRAIEILPFAMLNEYPQRTASVQVNAAVRACASTGGFTLGPAAYLLQGAFRARATAPTQPFKAAYPTYRIMRASIYAAALLDLAQPAINLCSVAK
jgi:hypothetical protein